jgi:hypothetical protein
MANNMLDDFSPFQCGLGRFANFVNVPLGDDNNYTVMRVYSHGEAEIYSDPLGDPILTFTPADAGMLRNLADELEANAGVYAEWLKEQNERHQPTKPQQSTVWLERDQEHPAATTMPTTAPAGAKPNGKQEVQPVLITGAAVNENLQTWSLR